jgi:hydrogenase maturation protein HypF
MRFGQNSSVKEGQPTRTRTRLRLAIRGAVQGVGFRPFVHRLATELFLTGWVNNSAQGVFLEVEGPRAAVEKFLLRLELEKPTRSFIQSLEPSWLDPVGYRDFEIRESETGGSRTTLVLPDIATCPDCLREIFDPTNRRYRYPFTNCTNCGPRFSIIESLPYDRVNTSMRQFKMCPQCRAEYDDPRDRRFHAQPNACPVCGPRLELWPGSRACESAESGEATARPRSHERGYNALLAAATAIREGNIVAVKGLGGFHLMVAAHDEKAVCRLRERKQREEKPLALMFPSLEHVETECDVSPLEERILCSPEAPIVLLKQRRVGGLEGWSAGKRDACHPNTPLLHYSISSSIAPGNPNLGVMLPYTPLHHLLLAELGFPVVATSGNLSDEPICTDEHEAVERLRSIADVFLVHNRPIVRHVDDSIVRVMLDREMILRRARGYAPLPISLKSKVQSSKSKTVLAVGAHLKNAVALSVGNQVFISQHIGDLETVQSFSAFQQVIADFQKLYEMKPELVAADLHPDYLSTKFASELCSPPLEFTLQRARTIPQGGIELQPRCVGVQHHIAHVHSCMAENELPSPVLGVSWDGTGYGLDGTVWGGEFFLVTDKTVERVAHLRPFRLPGGDQAVKEPRRAALGLLHELAGRDDKTLLHMQQSFAVTFSAGELATLVSMLERKVNSPLCSSVGRLFDAVASLIGLRQQIRFEGQAAMELEFVLEGVETEKHYELPLVTRHPSLVLDWSPMIEAILADVKNGVSTGLISAKFHNALAEGIIVVARHVGRPRVVLTGGCFQNRYLTERAVKRLQAEGFSPYWHQRVPPNDGGIALGQVVAALRENR